MKLRATLIPAIALSCSAVFAQDTSTTNTNQSGLQQSDPGRSIISEPAGADTQGPRGRAFSSDQPPGRAFSRTNPPPGRPFQGGQQPPGRPFTEGEEAGIPSDEPAGAEKPSPDTNSTPGIEEPSGAEQAPDSSSQTNQVDIQEPSGAESDASKEPDGQDQADISTDPAGAQKGDHQQLATAIGSIKGGVNIEQNVQLKQAIKTTIKGGNVPDEFVDRLSRDMSMAFSRTQVNQNVQVQLAQALNTVLTASPSNHTEVEQAITTVQQTLVQSGVAKPQARAVACDLHLIATELVPDLQLSIPTLR